MVSPGMLISERYEIVDKVGSGGMADVYSAKDLRLNRHIAIKILKQEYSSDAKFVAKFRAEAQSVAGLSHPNIVNVYDVGEDAGLYYIVMELVEGITLKKFIESKGKLEINEVIGIGIQIAQGIDEAHKNHIIHRDIKPQNIIISKEGKVKVTDFGIAKAATSNTITSNAMGSVHYISPEQARGGYSDAKSDIYSLGVTIYEMLSGKVPFEGESTVSVAFAHVHEAPVPLNELDSSIPMSLSRIVQKCMQKKPDFRYENAEALILDLRRAVSEPDGDYVVIEEPVTDSPTIKLSDDMIKTIKDPQNRPQVRTQERPAPVKEQKKEEEKPAAPVEFDDTKMDPKLERILKICSGIVAVIIVVVLILLIAKVMGVFEHGKKADSSEVSTSASKEPEASAEADTLVEVPDLIGHDIEEAQKMLDEKNLKAVLEGKESDKPVNEVIDQDPPAGKEVEEYTVVTIYYSVDKDDVVIPDVTKKSPSEAQRMLEELGLLVSGTTSQYSDSVDEGEVCGTDPVIGSSVKKGSSVTIVISKGPRNETVPVPNIVGRSEEVALEKLNEVNLEGGKVTYAYSDTYVKGRVIHQSKKAGTRVEQGTRIDYTVSLGPKEDATKEPTATPEEKYIYEGTITINANPFEYEGEEGMIKLILTQDGKSKAVFSKKMSYSDFPYKFTIYGWSDNNGTVKMCRDDKEIADSWNVEFRKVVK